MADIPLIDPLARTIVLHDRTWFGHIVKGHPEVRSRRMEAESALVNPKEIRMSTSDADCRLYYGMPSPSGIMMVVVADVVQGLVKTAYLAKKMKGAIEWSR